MGECQWVGRWVGEKASERASKHICLDLFVIVLSCAGGYRDCVSGEHAADARPFPDHIQHVPGPPAPPMALQQHLTSRSSPPQPTLSPPSLYSYGNTFAESAQLQQHSLYS